MRHELDPSTIVRTSDFTGFHGLRVIVRERPKEGSYSSGNRGISYFMFGYRPGPERGRTIFRVRPKTEFQTRMTPVSAIVPPETPFVVTYSQAAAKTTRFQFNPPFFPHPIPRAHTPPSPST